jgi:hypothetical protein
MASKLNLYFSKFALVFFTAFGLISVPIAKVHFLARSTSIRVTPHPAPISKKEPTFPKCAIRVLVNHSLDRKIAGEKTSGKTEYYLPFTKQLCSPLFIFSFILFYVFALICSSMKVFCISDKKYIELNININK